MSPKPYFLTVLFTSRYGILSEQVGNSSAHLTTFCRMFTLSISKDLRLGLGFHLITSRPESRCVMCNKRPLGKDSGVVQVRSPCLCPPLRLPVSLALPTMSADPLEMSCHSCLQTAYFKTSGTTKAPTNHYVEFTGG